jgi:hypothetical protein
VAGSVNAVADAGFVTVKATAAEVLLVSSAGVVAVKRAVRELLPIVVSVVVMQVAVPELTVTGLHANALVPFLKTTVPAAAAGVTVAVSFTLAPADAVVIFTVGADVSAAVSTVVVVAADTVTTFAVDGVAV